MRTHTSLCPQKKSPLLKRGALLTVIAVSFCLSQPCLQSASGQTSHFGDGYGSSVIDGGGYVESTPVGGNYFDATTKFASNANRPLGGLFAPDFTRTLSFFGGWNRIAQFANDPNTSPTRFDDDFAVGVAYGRRHSHFLRSEFSFSYRSNAVESSAIPAIPSAGPVLTGETEVYSIMKNFLMELPGNNSRITPYLGIGIGYAYVDHNLDFGSPIQSESNSGFAYQPIGGVGIDVSEKAEFFVEYRYFRTSALELTSGGAPTSLAGNYDAHNLFVGLRFEF